MLALICTIMHKDRTMDRKEFFKWLNACPTHKFEIVYDDYNGVYVNFTIADVPTPYVPPGYKEEESCDPPLTD